MLIRNHCHHVGHLFDAFLQRLLYHALEHEGNVALEGELQLTGGVGGGQQLYPQVEGYRTVLGLKLDGFQWLAVDNAQRYFAHHGGFDREAVGIEGEVVQLLGLLALLVGELPFDGLHAVFQALQIVEIAQRVIHRLLRISYLFYVTFECGHIFIKGVNGS